MDLLVAEIGAVPALSVQPDWNHSSGVIRGRIENGVLQEDCIELPDGRRICGADAMRAEVWTFDQHLAAWQAHHPGLRLRAWAGNGNLLSNPWFVGYTEGTLYHLAGEERHFSERLYSCLVVRGARVSIEDLRLPDLPADIDAATFGQRLIAGGQTIDLEALVAMARAGQFYDLRHLFLFGRIPLGEKRWIDAGRPAPDQLEDALRGRPIELDISQFDPAAVHAALAEKGYRDYTLRAGRLRLVLKPGVYPHSMIGLRADGTLVWAGVRGLSNRIGVSVLEAARIMHGLGCRDALLLDNGADVAFTLDGRRLLGPPPGERGRSRSLLLFAEPPQRFSDANPHPSVNNVSPILYSGLP